jgi:gamma-D-glutamyl-L-lysine dipeptidyl-peptidase
MELFGFCNLSIVPCRREPSDKSEMVTQLLFGEHFEILEEHKNWVYVNSALDDYKSWIDRKQYLAISKETFNRLNTANDSRSSDVVGIITETSDNISFPITIGSRLPFIKGKEFTIENKKYNFQGSVTTPGAKPKRSQIVEDSFTYMNAPYLWGGRSPFGIDCSGFTQMIYRLNGIKLLRDASQQVEQGETLDFPEEAKPGDLAFFDNEEGAITHVGIVLPDMQIIHASGRVHMDKLDHLGIYSEEKKNYTHNLRILKTLI